MDPLSIAASVAGIIAAAASMAKAIAPYASSLKTLPPIALRVRSEIINTQFLLGALQNLTQNLESSLASRTSLIDIDHLEWVFTDGVFIFSELESTVLSIEPPGERLGGVSRMTWVRSETTLKGLLERLGLFKESVLLLLNILQCNSDSQASLNQQALHRKVDTLRTGDEQLARRMMNLKNAFDSLSLLEKHSTAVSAKDSLAPDGAKSADAAESSPRPEVQHETATPGDEDWVALDSTPKEQAIFGPPLISMAQEEEIPVFTFDPILQDSRAYQRSRVDRSLLPSHTSAAQTNLWSIFSGITLSDISAIAAIALPVYPQDISNPQHYDFTRPVDAPRLQVRSAKSASSRLSRYKPFVDVDELWAANNEVAIGAWAQTRSKVFKFRELRYEFTCGVPLISVTRMMLRDIGRRATSPYIHLTGDIESRRRSFTAENTDRYIEKHSWLGWEEQPSDQAQASWLALLDTVQEMESESLRLIQGRPVQAQALTPTSEHQLDDARTIAVAIVPTIISWDSMPQGVKRGYGMTTWGGVVKLFAMLGVHWKTLDVPRKTYHAEGNGLVVTSQDVHGLGIVLRFQRQRYGGFAHQRAIPTASIEDLAFGQVETMDAAPWKAKDSSGRVRRMNGPRRLRLDFGSPESTVASLTRLGCNSRATQCFSQNNPRRSRVFHLFPVLFEVIGMLGSIHHSKKMPFRLVPNPTMFHWDQSAESMQRLLNSFRAQLVASKSRHETTSRYVDEIHTLALGLLSKDWGKHVPAEQLHDALEHCDKSIRDYLSYGPGWPKDKPKTTGLSELTERARGNQDLIFKIVSRHLQEIMSLLNGKEIMTAVDESSESGQSDTTPTTLTEVDEASPEDAPSKLMDIYFNIVRPKVTKDLHVTMEVNEAEPEIGPDGVLLPSLDELWYTLVFRMICWLSLHDFNEADVQRSQSLFCHNNLRVFIS